MTVIRIDGYLCLMAALLLMGSAFGQEGGGEYVDIPGDPPKETREHHRKIPKDDIWWTVRGPEMGWLHRNLQQIFPTAPVYRRGSVSELTYEPMADIADYPVDVDGEILPFAKFLASDRSTALGVVIVHKGRIVFEQYPRMRPFEKPIYWSSTKVFAGAVIRLLEEQGKLDTSQTVDQYIARLKNTPFGSVTVRNVLDHATGLDCGDEYD
ncbi:MAG: serine hydrolase domain-containing protein, partial [Pseudomonadota bacterium]